VDLRDGSRSLLLVLLVILSFLLIIFIISFLGLLGCRSRCRSGWRRRSNNRCRRRRGSRCLNDHRRRRRRRSRCGRCRCGRSRCGRCRCGRCNYGRRWCLNDHRRGSGRRRLHYGRSRSSCSSAGWARGSGRWLRICNLLGGVIRVLLALGGGFLSIFSSRVCRFLSTCLSIIGLRAGIFTSLIGLVLQLLRVLIH